MIWHILHDNQITAYDMKGYIIHVYMHTCIHWEITYKGISRGPWQEHVWHQIFIEMATYRDLTRIWKEHPKYSCTCCSISCFVYIYNTSVCFYTINWAHLSVNLGNVRILKRKKHPEFSVSIEALKFVFCTSFLYNSVSTSNYQLDRCLKCSKRRWISSNLCQKYVSKWNRIRINI